jgi:7-cyano-7-deazaguanine synthase in queuosine biosynthesis
MDERLPYPATHEEVVALKKEYKNRMAQEKIERMYKAYGRYRNPMMTCGDCRHCIEKQFARTYWKCELFGNTEGPRTDWTKRWQACGRFEKRS